MTANTVPGAGNHGGDAARVAAALGFDPAQVLDLSASMNPFAPDVADLLAADSGRLRLTIGRYPDPTEGAALLAEELKVDPRRVILTNGGAEAIALVAASMASGWIENPEFSLYRRHLTVIEPSAPRWRSNPSNPLGLLADATDHAAVWDEAFYPIATGTWTRGDESAWRLGSLTKLWNCPGLRLGYAIAPTVELAEALRQRQPQWAVNGVALMLIPELLECTDLVGWQHALVALREQFADSLSALGYAVRQTAVNWLLIDDSVGLRERLAMRGVVVRDCASFGLHGVHRTAVPRRSDLDRVITAFAAEAQS